MNADDLLKSINRVRGFDLSVTDIESLRGEVRGLLPDNYVAVGRLIQPGTDFYRIVAYDSMPSRVDQISYPPTNVARSHGRCNRAGTSVFYCSNSRVAPHYEVDLKKGDRYVLSQWRSNQPMYVLLAGYTYSSVLQMGSDRLPASYIPEQQSPLQSLFTEFLASEITKNVPPGREDEYKLTIAFAENQFESTISNSASLGALMYPTIPMKGNADNFVLRPSVVDEKLKLIEVAYHEITDINDGQLSTTEVDFACTTSSDGLLEWKGRQGQWKPDRPTNEIVTATAHEGRWVLTYEDGTVIDRC